MQAYSQDINAYWLLIEHDVSPQSGDTSLGSFIQMKNPNEVSLQIETLRNFENPHDVSSQ